MRNHGRAMMLGSNKPLDKTVRDQIALSAESIERHRVLKTELMAIQGELERRASSGGSRRSSGGGLSWLRRRSSSS
jgi:hypothetical protein